MRPRQTLDGMCFPATTLHSILEGKGNVDTYKKLLKNLKEFHFQSSWQSRWHGDEIDEMRRQFWRLHDLCDGGGFDIMVELFFLALSQLLSTSSSRESHSALYMGTFRAIISEWNEFKHSFGTQNLFLDM